MNPAATLYASVYACVDPWEMLYVAPSCTLAFNKYERILELSVNGSSALGGDHSRIRYSAQDLTAPWTSSVT